MIDDEETERQGIEYDVLLLSDVMLRSNLMLIFKRPTVHSSQDAAVARQSQHLAGHGHL